jgi:uncharacterized protein YdhG (YjbR/CyaY superfamily)
MPVFNLNGTLVYFAAYKHHIGFYATSNGNDAFKDELPGYKTRKGSVQSLLNQPMPLIKRIVAFRVKENEEKNKLKAKPQKR